MEHEDAHGDEVAWSPVTVAGRRAHHSGMAVGRRTRQVKPKICEDKLEKKITMREGGGEWSRAREAKHILKTQRA
jgi:hypothetical protein